ncbi:MAG TPA: ATP-binding cassette domain-containing protein, partial [Clostridia bacterium]|nr:ATP-binding cassette domain-containing protein [Clostridia bacterium]
MINVTDVSLQFGDQVLFKDVNVKFYSDNCYGIIGANGAGKSTFLKILSGEVEPNKGNVSMPPDERMAVLEQDHFKYDDFTVMETVLMGHKRLYEIMKEKDALYSKDDFTEADGLKAAELEGEFEELDGWDAEMNAEKILIGLGIEKESHGLKMSELQGGEKVKVLLGKA